MKLTISFKDPDALSDMIDDAVEKEVSALNLSTEEAEEVENIRRQKVSDKLSRWVEYGEYIRIEFDTDAGTASVLPVER